MLGKLLLAAEASGDEASSTTIISTSAPASAALCTACGSKCGRLRVAMMILARAIRVIGSTPG
jgi:hypothetical protein